MRDKKIISGRVKSKALPKTNREAHWSCKAWFIGLDELGEHYVD